MADQNLSENLVSRLQKYDYVEEAGINESGEVYGVLDKSMLEEGSESFLDDFESFCRDKMESFLTVYMAEGPAKIYSGIYNEEEIEIVVS